MILKTKYSTKIDLKECFSHNYFKKVQKGLHPDRKYGIINSAIAIMGRNSVGRVSHWQCGSREFESHRLHQNLRYRMGIRRFFHYRTIRLEA